MGVGLLIGTAVDGDEDVQQRYTEDNHLKDPKWNSNEDSPGDSTSCEATVTSHCDEQ